MKIMYVHGLLGSATGSATQLLKKSFPDDEILSVEYDNYDCKKAMEDILDFYHTHPEIDVIIGCSLGGFYAQMLCNRPKILINPAFNGGKDTVRYVKDALDKLSPTFASDLDEMLAGFFRNEYDYEYYCETTTVFCRNDDVITFDEERLDLYKQMYRTKDIRITYEGKHRLTEEVIPVIAEIVEEIKKRKGVRY